MVTEVSPVKRELPEAWKARLRDQPQTERSTRDMSYERGRQEDYTEPKVFMEPTEPENDKGLPAFRIKQKIETQPTDVTFLADPSYKDVKVSVLVALAGVATLGAGLLVATL